ncbi:structural maintenance of chromosomes flexible hinge domain-containing protein GMI1-like isoform X1 [Gossypium arboreum]|nr:structural maintenance of chromosomes flexible hinge domain-containing protein GMI1-like isoform X1 [Gossypium arboreum]XP_052876665.1 structural maintenance of chromosomes flexible hinge domain-containing protein GMI1-like isoform X1 [Gossypium arboreum]XP_052876666.1 structural maintenance of chromosomes flexible hinge domain-containing protein GMI1-like isoform X1 [Gossypium arboreum]
MFHFLKLIKQLQHPDSKMKALKELDLFAVKNERNRKYMVEAGVPRAMPSFIVNCFKEDCVSGLEEALSALFLIRIPSAEAKLLPKQNDQIIKSLIWVLGCEFNTQVDNLGRIDLRGLLKVTAGYGKQVSLSILHGDKVTFKQAFQPEKRELRISSSIPEHCLAGSTLENISFEVIDSKGDVDGTFHDDEKCGRFHTLVVKSESHQIDDSIHYAFKHGRCNIASLPLPQTEGPLFFKAFHSRYTELYCDVEVGKKSCAYQVMVNFDFAD